MPGQQTRLDHPTFAAFVLAGGASSRMGVDKALLTIQGRTLVERAVATMQAAGLLTSIVGIRADLTSFAPVVSDVRTANGPLSGIEAAMLASRTDYCVFMPVDLPFLPSAFFNLLMQRVLLTSALATVPCFEGAPQPLCAVYHSGLLAAVTKALDSGDRKVMRVLRHAAPAEGAIDQFDVESALAAAGNYSGWPAYLHQAFFNCNTPADFRIAEQQVQ